MEDKNKDYSELLNEVHWDTVLTMPFQLNKKVKMYHYSEKKIDGELKPVAINIGNKLARKPRRSIWWTRNPENFEFPIFNFIQCEVRYLEDGRRTFGNEVLLVVDDKIIPEVNYHRVFFVIHEPFYKKYKAKFDNLKSYRYEKTFKYKELGRGTENHTDEWTYDKPVKPDSVTVKTFKDLINEKVIVIADGEEFEKYKSVAKVSNSKEHYQDWIGRKEDWFKYNEETYNKKRNEYEKKHGIPSYKEIHNGKFNLAEDFSYLFENVYEPPYNAEQIKKHYGVDLYNKLKSDKVHSWRMETGIELIHKEPTKKELERIWKNWQLMPDDMKKKSDEKSIELFGVDNKTNYERLISEDFTPLLETIVGARKHMLKKEMKDIYEETIKYDDEGPCGNNNCMLCTLCLAARRIDPLKYKNLVPRPVFSPSDIIFDTEFFSDKEKIKIKNIDDLYKLEDGDYYVHVAWKEKGGHEFLINVDRSSNNVIVADAQANFCEDLNELSARNYFDVNFDKTYLVYLKNKSSKDFEKYLEYNDKKYILPWEKKRDMERLKKDNLLESTNKYQKEETMIENYFDIDDFDIFREELLESVLDPINKTRCKEIFDNNDNMKSDVQKFILDIVNGFKKEVDFNIRNVYMIGSSTGYQYTATSDIDIEVETDLPKDKLWSIIKLVPKGTLLPNTQKPINLFVLDKDTSYDFKNAENVYDVVSGKWLKDSGKEKVEIPYPYIKGLATYFMNGCDLAISEFNKDMKELQEYMDLDPETQEISQKEKVEAIDKKIVDLRKDIDSLKMAHHVIFGFEKEGYEGMPFKISIDSELNKREERYSVNNLVYKYIDKFGYLDKMNELMRTGRDKIKEVEKYLKGLKSEDKKQLEEDYTDLLLEAKFWTCQKHHANLDIGEKCDECEAERKKKEEEEALQREIAKPIEKTETKDRIKNDRGLWVDKRDGLEYKSSDGDDLAEAIIIDTLLSDTEDLNEANIKPTSLRWRLVLGCMKYVSEEAYYDAFPEDRELKPSRKERTRKLKEAMNNLSQEDKQKILDMQKAKALEAKAEKIGRGHRIAGAAVGAGATVAGAVTGIAVGAHTISSIVNNSVNNAPVGAKIFTGLFSSIVAIIAGIIAGAFPLIIGGIISATSNAIGARNAKVARNKYITAANEDEIAELLEKDIKNNKDADLEEVITKNVNEDYSALFDNINKSKDYSNLFEDVETLDESFAGFMKYLFVDTKKFKKKYPIDDPNISKTTLDVHFYSLRADLYEEISFFSNACYFCLLPSERDYSKDCINFFQALKRSIKDDYKKAKDIELKRKAVKNYEILSHEFADNVEAMAHISKQWVTADKAKQMLVGTFGKLKVDTSSIEKRFKDISDNTKEIIDETLKQLKQMAKIVFKKNDVFKLTENYNIDYSNLFEDAEIDKIFGTSDFRYKINDVLKELYPIVYGFISIKDGSRIDDREFIHNCDHLSDIYKVNYDPTVTLKNKLGICTDQSIATQYLMNKYHPEIDCELYALTKGRFGHCVCTLKDLDKYYYLENAWDKKRGLHGPFASKEELEAYLDKCYHEAHDKDNDDPVFVRPYKEYIKENLNESVNWR